jgi:hypothetical protein
MVLRCEAVAPAPRMRDSCLGEGTARPGHPARPEECRSGLGRVHRHLGAGVRQDEGEVGSALVSRGADPGRSPPTALVIEAEALGVDERTFLDALTQRP